jgi:hypothetical protein
MLRTFSSTIQLLPTCNSCTVAIYLKPPTTPNDGGHRTKNAPQLHNSNGPHTGKIAIIDIVKNDFLPFRCAGKIKSHNEACNTLLTLLELSGIEHSATRICLYNPTTVNSPTGKQEVILLVNSNAKLYSCL